MESPLNGSAGNVSFVKTMLKCKVIHVSIHTTTYT